MKVCVIGGGHGAYAAAAELTENDHHVTWWRREQSAFDALTSVGHLDIKDHRGERRIPVDGGGISVTADLRDAVAAADVIVLPIPAFAHDDLATALAPHLQDGQVVYLPPGSFGSFIFARALHDSGNPADVAFAETGTLPYLARKYGESRVVVSGYATRLPTGVFPARHTDRALAILAEVYPSVERVEDALSGALMNAGPIIHPPLILMNAGPLEHFPAWDIHNEGTQDSIRRVTSALDAERIAVRRALGYAAPHFPLADHYSADGDEWMYGNAAHEKLTDSGDWREKIDLHTHRYMTEDVEIGLALLSSVGHWASVPTPVADGLLALAGAITGRATGTGGRTLDALGLSDLDRDSMSDFLRNGFSR